MNKKLLLIVGIIGFVVLLIVTYLQSSSKSTKTEVPTTALPQTAKTKIVPTIPVGNTFQIAGVTLNNFYKGNTKIKPDGEVTISETSEHIILYTPNKNYFLISITGSPFTTVRTEAENAFIKSLGITQAQACKLYVVVATTLAANKDYASKAYRLSFCK